MTYIPGGAVTVVASGVDYTPTNPTAWTDPDPVNVAAGLDALADRPAGVGPKGDKGDTGDQGIQGIQGIKGDKGDTGDPGGGGGSVDPYALRLSSRYYS